MDRERKLKIFQLYLRIMNVLLLLCKYILLRQRERAERRWWVHPVNRTRCEKGYFEVTFLPLKNMAGMEIKERDPSDHFFEFSRMKRNTYAILLSLLQDDLAIKSMREPVSPECRLAMTLIYLSQGVSIKYLASSFKYGRSTVREVVLETCETIWKVLSGTYVARPSEVDYNIIANGFETQWDMPNCVGAIDGKHIEVQAPPKSGSQYFNYKKTFSIVLLGVCDSNYLFTEVNVGAYGSQSDRGVLRESTFGRELLANRLTLPQDKKLPNSERMFPHYYVGDAAFPLKNNVMRPYSGRNLSEEEDIFNYRLSRARRVIENAFGILVNRWRILRNSMILLPENAEKVVLASVALHNFIKLNDTSNVYIHGHNRQYVDWEDEEHRMHEDEWRRDGTLPTYRMGANNASREAFNLRNTLCDYFMNEGSVPFQWGRH